MYLSFVFFCFFTVKHDIILIVPPGLFFTAQRVEGILRRGGAKSLVAPSEMTRERHKTVQGGRRKEDQSVYIFICSLFVSVAQWFSTMDSNLQTSCLETDRLIL